MHTYSQPQTLGSDIKDNDNFLISYYGLRGKEVFSSQFNGVSVKNRRSGIEDKLHLNDGI
jgi:hypothetical protein